MILLLLLIDIVVIIVIIIIIIIISQESEFDRCRQLQILTKLVIILYLSKYDLVTVICTIESSKLFQIFW